MTSTVVATTRSGSRYVILVEDDGARWVRLPASTRSHPHVGWLSQPPRVVSGERLLLGNVRSTPVVRVAFLPGPEAPRPAVAETSQDQRPWNLRSMLGGQRH
jgi:hypothetical protein